jgi:hypothetical protein
MGFLFLIMIANKLPYPMKKILSLIFAIFSFGVADAQQVNIVLKRSFLDELASKTSLSVDYIVDKSHPRPNPPSKDADLHFAGRSKKIGMNSVGEIMNARDEDETVQFIKSLQGKDQKITIEGAWRIWCEHPNEQDEFVQSATVKPATSTNPPHIFEIHPVTQVESTDLSGTLHHISGYKYKKAENAFRAYASTPFEIKKLSNKRVQLLTRGVGYNYVKFKAIMLEEQPFDAADGGSFVLAQILDEDEEVIVPKIRLVFLKGSKPQEKARTWKQDEVLTFVGIPRISASLIKWRLDNYKNPEYRDALEWSLPYEMIVAAVLSTQEAKDAEDLIAGVTD